MVKSLSGDGRRDALWKLGYAAGISSFKPSTPEGDPAIPSVEMRDKEIQRFLPKKSSLHASLFCFFNWRIAHD
jgi:hypothetical protein